jgi:hypothetical protein
MRCARCCSKNRSYAWDWPYTATRPKTCHWPKRRIAHTCTRCARAVQCVPAAGGVGRCVAGLSFDSFKALLVQRGLQPRLGPADEQDARQEIAALDQILPE